jgi:hypothetical protein
LLRLAQVYDGALVATLPWNWRNLGASRGAALPKGAVELFAKDFGFVKA